MKKDIYFNAIQKFYSALRNLNNFSLNNDAIDNISSLDCFFSEFRNITFVLQKDFSDNGDRKLYEEKCTEYLINKEMKWFITQRNNITKQSPIKLEKNIIIDIYMPNNRITIESEKLKLNIEESFKLTKDFIKEMLLEKIGMKDVYFSTRIVFKEDEKDIEIFPKIISGVETMIRFFEDILKNKDSKEFKSIDLFSKCTSLYEAIIINNYTFIHDYYTESGEIKSVDKDIQFYFKEENLLKKISNYRVPLNKEIFGYENDVEKIFKKFEIMHIIIYNISNRNINPVFMILYRDFSTKLIPIYATHKTTIYREVYNIIDNTDFKEVMAIFYCGEMYIYNAEKINIINDLDYSDRIKNADTTVLSFFYINDEGKVKSVNFDIKNINNNEYIKKELQKENEFNDNNQIFFLQPIIEEKKKSLVT